MPDSKSSKPIQSDIEEIISIQRARRKRTVVILSVLLPSLMVLVLLLTMKVVVVEVLDPRDGNVIRVSVTQGLGFGMGDKVVLWGQSLGEIRAEGYYPNITEVSRATKSPLQIELEPLPGTVLLLLADSLMARSSEFKVIVNEQDTFDPLPSKVQLKKGNHVLRIIGPNGYDRGIPVAVEGYGQEQSVQIDPLVVGHLTVNVFPADGIIELNGNVIGEGTYSGPVPVGEYELLFHAEKHVNKTVPLTVSEGENIDLETIELRQLPGVVRLNSNPLEASLLINGGFIGSTPKVLTIHERSFELTVRKPDYQTIVETIVVQPGQDETYNFVLEPSMYEVKVESTPIAAVTLNQESQGDTPTTVTVKVGDVLQVSKEGYAGQTISLASESSQVKELKFTLVALEKNAYENAAATVVIQGSIEMKKFAPMSTRALVPKELGKDGHAAHRTFEITKPFYMGTHEIRRKEYAKFVSTTTVNSDNENLPITEVTWLDAIKFCNWLSQQEGFENVYTISPGNDVTINTEADGFRLPTEAEWEAVAQFDFQKQENIGYYPWGNIDKPPTGIGNLAGFETREGLQVYMEAYTDNHIGLAPVGSYKSNVNGIYDLEGNVSEWVWDFFDYPQSGWEESQVDPLGPPDGLDRLVKGGSFRSSELSDLFVNARRVISFEDGTVGFRVARWIL